MKSINPNAYIELKHIQLELNNARNHHFRHFVDQFYCYKHGFITESGKASPDKILWNGYVSRDASQTKDRSEVTKEHVFPLKLITQKLEDSTNASKISLLEIENIIDRYLIFCTITKEEDSALRKLGLTSSMPEEFYDEKSLLFGDIFARYKIAKIEINDHSEC